MYNCWHVTSLWLCLSLFITFTSNYTHIKLCITAYAHRSHTYTTNYCTEKLCKPSKYHLEELIFSMSLHSQSSLEQCQWLGVFHFHFHTNIQVHIQIHVNFTGKKKMCQHRFFLKKEKVLFFLFQKWDAFCYFYYG